MALFILFLLLLTTCEAIKSNYTIHHHHSNHTNQTVVVAPITCINIICYKFYSEYHHGIIHKENALGMPSEVVINAAPFQDTTCPTITKMGTKEGLYYFHFSMTGVYTPKNNNINDFGPVRNKYINLFHVVCVIEHFIWHNNCYYC